ncbi:MAG: alanine dehydrogenase [Spirochaetales bacterium]|nr:MAG: alanine dehydrogenase [Spirochaetales bacterium]
MKIGTVKEIKTHEYRVGLTPSCVKSYVSRGHRVMVETGAGISAGFEDEDYTAAGGILADRETIFRESEMIVKVKEPVPEEYGYLRKGQIIYTYLHLAASRELTDTLLGKKVKAVAYETIETADGSLPCLKPMSEIAGRLAVQEGAKYLEKTYGGRGVLLGGVPGVERGKVAIIGGGVVGTNACKIAVGMGAEVTILDINAKRLEYLDDIFSTRITTLYNTDYNLEKVLSQSDLVIGAVLLPGAKAPQIIKRGHLKLMKRGAVIVDVAVDQGGCVETTRPTTHEDPVFVVDNVVHYCVANMPGAVALSSTRALTSTTLPYGLLIAEAGIEEACRKSPALLKGLNIYDGTCVYPAVAQAFNLSYTPPERLLF